MEIPVVKVFEPTSRLFSAANTSDLLSWINESIEAGADELLVDLKYVMFMDSRGLGALVAARTRAQAAGCRLAICSLNGQALMLFEMADINSIFDIFPDRVTFEQSLVPA